MHRSLSRLSKPLSSLVTKQSARSMATIDASVTLHTGAKMPLIGLGTWAQTNQAGGDEHAASLAALKTGVKTAIDAGYRLIDTAWSYQNETAIGEALQEVYAEGKVKREDLFITTKLWAFHFEPELVEKTLRQQLKDLQTDYVDLYLMHVPIPWPQDPARPMALYPITPDGKVKTGNTPHLETWRALEACVKKGLVRHIGVSNFNSKQVQRLLDQGEVPPACLQVECHPFRPQKELSAWCASKGVAFTAYSPLGSPGAAAAFAKSRGLNIPSIMGTETVQNIAKAHGKSPAQVLVRFALDRNIAVIPKSTNPERIKANIDVYDFHLTKEEIAALEGMAQPRLLDVFAFAKDHPEYPFNEPF